MEEGKPKKIETSDLYYSMAPRMVMVTVRVLVAVPWQMCVLPDGGGDGGGDAVTVPMRRNGTILFAARDLLFFILFF